MDAVFAPRWDTALRDWNTACGRGNETAIIRTVKTAGLGQGLGLVHYLPHEVTLGDEEAETTMTESAAKFTLLQVDEYCGD